MTMNISPPSSQPSEQIALIFHALSVPTRVQILLVIGAGEVCVCHLEAYLGLRQALISQHLMALREYGLVIPYRDGRNIYYRLASPILLDLVKQAALTAGLNPMELSLEAPPTPCPCPHCNASLTSSP